MRSAPARKALRRGRKAWRERVVVPLRSRAARKELERHLAGGRAPRIVVVKQDVQDDLYCCPPGTPAREVVLSTLMRTGPVALFTRLDADFLMVATEPDAETSIWRQRWEEVGWTPIEAMESLRERVFGRDHGQGDFAVAADAVDWSRWDIVIGVDVAVPARVTARFGDVVWAYYVREPKTSAFRASRDAPLGGMDLFLNQGFALRPAARRAHEVEFPYYLQYHGCFHDLLGVPRDDGARRGVFLEHHTPEALGEAELRLLSDRYGAVDSTAARDGDAFRKGNVKSDRDAAQILRGLMASRYFVKLGGPRNVFGNAMVEAIAAGCLCLGDPDRHVHADLYDDVTTVRTFHELIQRLERLEADQRLYRSAVERQRRLVDYLCWERPMLDLLNAASVLRDRPWAP